MKSYNQLQKEILSLRGEIRKEIEYLPLEKLEVKIKRLHQMKDELKRRDELSGIIFSSGDHSYNK